MTSTLSRTSLHTWHAEHGARLVDFTGWSMPVQYDSASGANVDPGYIVTAQDAITVPTIGVFNGCFYTDANTLKPTFSAFYPGGTVPAANVNN